MLEIARPDNARTAARSQPDKCRWGVVDAILGLVMLPFGLWLLAIEGIVRVAAWLCDIDSHRLASSVGRSSD